MPLGVFAIPAKATVTRLLPLQISTLVATPASVNSSAHNSESMKSGSRFIHKTALAGERLILIFRQRFR